MPELPYWPASRAAWLHVYLFCVLWTPAWCCGRGGAHCDGHKRGLTADCGCVGCWAPLCRLDCVAVCLQKGAKKASIKITLDCTQPVTDGVLDTASLVRLQRLARGWCRAAAGPFIAGECLHP